MSPVTLDVLIQASGPAWRGLRVPLALAGGAFLALSLAALAAFYAWRGTIEVAEKPTGRLIERFDRADRWAHWTMGITFVLLALTGLVISYGKYVLLPLVGHPLYHWVAYAAKSLHNFAGPTFILSLGWFISRFLCDNLPRLCDLDWLKKGGGMFTRAHVPSGRFNAGEKTLFWGLVCGFSVLQCATGLVLDFPNAGLGRLAMQSADVLHYGVALVALCASLFHMYLGTIGVAGAYRGMRTGLVDESWAREHHELWYEDVKAGRSRQHFV